MAPFANRHARLIAVLRSSSVFGSLRQEILQALAHAMTLRSVHGGQTVIRGGEACDSNAPDSAEQGLAQTFVLLPLLPGASHALGQDLNLAFAKHGRVAHLRAAAAERQLLLNNEALPLEALARIEAAHEFILYETSGGDCAWTRFAFRQADQPIFIAQADAAAPLTPMALALGQEPGYGLKRRHLVLRHAPNCAQSVSPTPWLQGRDLERTYPVRRGSQADAARAALPISGSCAPCRSALSRLT
ncbi:hypothetical protein [Roseateles sp.]|uniref:hypothetical protein n=1 Tax=Roseateles sp. TaxID=1971397 RepID=UPI00286CF0E8|nr:hypothetical protein [Roseateles sp.]